MAKKKKNIKSNTNKKERIEDNPFSKIKLKEIKEEKKTITSTLIKKETKTVEKDEKKKPHEIVQGYNPNSNFADILYSYEKTGNPFSLKKPKWDKEEKTKNQDGVSFEKILEKWEGKKVKEEVKNEKVKHYEPKRSFSSLLDEYENKRPKNENKKEIKEEGEEKQKEKIKGTDFFKTSIDYTRDKKASWSILGDNESFVREEKRKEKVEKNIKKEGKKKESYRPKREFSELLNEYEKKKSEKEKEKITLVEVKEELRQEEKPEKEEEEKEKRSIVAVWSVLGDNENYKREEKSELTEEDVKLRKKIEITFKKSFENTLNDFEKDKTKVKTFEEILKEKNENKEKSKIPLSLNFLRSINPEATLDLHGEKLKDVEREVNEFLLDSKNLGLKKVSIITGKGLHSKEGSSVIKKEVEKILSSSPFVREKSNAPQRSGGIGAIWIILKL